MANKKTKKNSNLRIFSTIFQRNVSISPGACNDIAFFNFRRCSIPGDAIRYQRTVVSNEEILIRI